MSKILTASDGAVRSILLNKPTRLNALDQEMLREIERLFVVWEGEPEAAVVVVGSTHVNAFCAGADLECVAELNATTIQEWEILGSRVFQRIESSRLISIASVPGYALGGGLTLALSCDLRLCSTAATFGQPEIALGWIPGWGGVTRLCRAIGIVRGKELCLTGARINSDTADRFGLVNKVCSPEALLEETKTMAQTIACHDSTALRAIKMVCHAQSSLPNTFSTEFDAFANSYLLAGECGQAAIANFLKRRENAK